MAQFKWDQSMICLSRSLLYIIVLQNKVPWWSTGRGGTWPRTNITAQKLTMLQLLFHWDFKFD